MCGTHALFTRAHATHARARVQGFRVKLFLESCACEAHTTHMRAHAQGFRVKLFLESFGVRAALLNAELPLNSRAHILQSFSRGLFDTLIATGAWGRCVRMGCSGTGVLPVVGCCSQGGVALNARAKARGLQRVS